MDAELLIPIFGIVGVFGMPLGIVVAGLYFDKRNKDKFHTTLQNLINQEQASRKLKRKLWVSLLLITAGLFLLLSPISEMMNYFILNLSSINTVDIFKMAVVSYGFSFVWIVLLKKRVLIL